MLPGMEHQAGVQVRPRVSYGLTTLENDMVDSLATELPRRCQTRRAGADHDGVMVGWRRDRGAEALQRQPAPFASARSKQRFSRRERFVINARRFSSVPMRHQTS